MAIDKWIEAKTPEEQNKLWLESMDSKPLGDLQKELQDEIEFATIIYPEISKKGRFGAPSSSNWKINALRGLIEQRSGSGN